MKFGFLGLFLLAVLVVFGGGFAWLALAKVPVQQQDMVVDVPVGR